ncbi:hypothetical protein HMPREF0083_01562 [Aneurinibacillus aneurinilyticus ATCC 12856]|uniref:Uncharacterized protein n=1 Tax=Aneurinibacillus aneurinilyticus ATCC 12856 TaxID=649747 RepID=U1YHU9_ANEAE|nr:hypothetical protein HMPREF0083_01562 [Aneurinibacillus aneurinilyticus ATCC 12856]
MTNHYWQYILDKEIRFIVNFDKYSSIIVAKALVFQGFFITGKLAYILLCLQYDNNQRGVMMS